MDLRSVLFSDIDPFKACRKFAKRRLRKKKAKRMAKLLKKSRKKVRGNKMPKMDNELRIKGKYSCQLGDIFTFDEYPVKELAKTNAYMFLPVMIMPVSISPSEKSIHFLLVGVDPAKISEIEVSEEKIRLVSKIQKDVFEVDRNKLGAFLLKALPMGKLDLYTKIICLPFSTVESMNLSNTGVRMSDIREWPKEAIHRWALCHLGIDNDVSGFLLAKIEDKAELIENFLKRYVTTYKSLGINPLEKGSEKEPLDFELPTLEITSDELKEMKQGIVKVPFHERFGCLPQYFGLNGYGLIKLENTIGNSKVYIYSRNRRFPSPNGDGYVSSEGHLDVEDENGVKYRMDVIFFDQKIYDRIKAEISGRNSLPTTCTNPPTFRYKGLILPELTLHLKDPERDLVVLTEKESVRLNAQGFYVENGELMGRGGYAIVRIKSPGSILQFLYSRTGALPIMGEYECRTLNVRFFTSIIELKLFKYDAAVFQSAVNHLEDMGIEPYRAPSLRARDKVKMEKLNDYGELYGAKINCQLKSIDVKALEDTIENTIEKYADVDLQKFYKFDKYELDMVAEFGEVADETAPEEAPEEE